MDNPLTNLFELRDLRTKRISSYDRSGGNADCVAVEAGTAKVLAEIPGAGIIRHIWITMASDDEMIRRNAVLRMYWDGEETPSVLSPLGDFFGQGWGEKYNFISLPLAAAPAGGNALNSYWPMPFGNGARIEVLNESALPIKSFYYYIDYEEHPSMPPSAGRFHAWWNRELTGPGPEGENEWALLGPYAENRSDASNYLFAEIEGRGHFAGVNYYVDNPGPIWYGEGDDMWLVDGEPWPGSLHGTGTEDFFNSSWCPNEIYQHPFFGYARIPGQGTGPAASLGWLGRTHCYRFFLADPIRFSRSLRASIEHGHANCLTLDLCSVAYWYQAEPHRPFPPLRPAGERGNMPGIGVKEIHLWRDAWRRANGGGLLWGNEKK
ncbi:MAG: glycoside hydrolase family 172 protein [Patescibacteria group bacterium]